MKMGEFLELADKAGFNGASNADGGVILRVDGEYAGMVSDADGRLMLSIHYPDKPSSLLVAFDSAGLRDDTGNVILSLAGNPVGVLSCRA